jgi:hypothetical protein
MICHQCHWKMRIKDNIKCTMCKSDNDAVILSMDRDLRFDEIDLRILNVSEKGSLYFFDQNVEQKFKRLLEINCPVPGCGK